MAKDLDQVQYYYDSHPTEEDLMGETAWHDRLIDYLKAVLSWLFREQVYAIYSNLNFYQTRNSGEYPVAPDIAIIKGVPYRYTSNWVLADGDPPPQAIFEVLSKETWRKDVYEKPSIYAHMGVLEYFTYDPHEPPIRRGDVPQLLGWRLNSSDREMVPILPNRDGWLWSEQLESWLVPDGISLRLYDRHHHLRLTEAQALAQQAEFEAERAAIEAERAKAESQRAKAEAQRAALEAERAEAAIRKAQALAEQLRALGINPDEIEPS